MASNTGPPDGERQSIGELVEETRQLIDEGQYPQSIVHNKRAHSVEMDRIFQRTWNYIGHESELQEPGDYARRYIGEDPYIFVRDATGEIHAFLDSCCHRGAQFATAQQGNTSHFRCPYHGWTYKNDGSLQGMPYKSEGYQDLDLDAQHLIEAETETYAGLVFARVADEGPTLEAYLGEFTWYLDVLFDFTERGMTVVGQPHRYEFDFSWKVGADNFSGDSYHVMVTHQSGLEYDTSGENPLWDAMDDFPECSYLATSNHHAGGYYMLTDDDEAFNGWPDRLRDHLDPDLTDEQVEFLNHSVFHFGNLFPNMAYISGMTTAGDVESWGCLRKWVPRGPGTSEIMSWFLVPEELTDDEAYMQGAHKAWESLGPSGFFESDDVSIWGSITESGKARTHRTKHTTGNVQLGMDGMSDDVEPVTDEMHGPGEVTTNGLYFDERGNRAFYRNWCDYMAGATDAQ